MSFSAQMQLVFNDGRRKMSSFFYRPARRFFFNGFGRNGVRSRFVPVVGALLCGVVSCNFAAQAQDDVTDDGEAATYNAARNYNATQNITPPANTVVNPAANYDAPNLYAAPQPTARPAEAQKRMQENNIRNLMRSLGIGSRDVQDTVIAHIASETQAREPMAAASGRLLQAMRTPGITDNQLSILLNDCRVSFDTDRTRRVEALDALKNKLGPDLSPRIESMILLLGLDGDVVITLPTPALLTQMQRERQQLLRMVDGLKIEADSLRRERDDVKVERDNYARLMAGNSAILVANAPNQLITQTANAQITPGGLYTVPASNAVVVTPSVPTTPTNLTEEQRELARLREENESLKKENQRLQREKNKAQRAKEDIERKTPDKKDAKDKKEYPKENQ